MHHRRLALPAIGLAITGLLATVTTAVAQAQVPTDCVTDASASEPIERVSGANRFATAACVSAVAHPDGAETVIVARGDSAGGWADALAGTILSRAINAPVLLTSPNDLPDETADEIRRLDAGEVIVLGGRGAVSAGVERDLAALGPVVRRISGSDRAATAAAIAHEADASGTAFLVNGHRPADALVAGATAARQGAALLLSETGSLPQATLDALDDLAIRDVVVVGGGTVIDDVVLGQLIARFGADHVRRVSGPTRQETAASMARAFPTDGTIHLVAARDTSLVDAIGASWLAARPGGGPVLYVDGPIIGRGSDRWLRLGGLTAGAEVRIVGGTNVVEPAVVDQLESRFDEAGIGGPEAQVRAMWIQLFDGTLKSRSSIDRMLNAAVDANLNTVIVQSARRHDAYYTTDQIPRTTDPTMPADLDMLGTLVPAAHARGLDVHVWYSVMPSYHPVYDGIGVAPDHVYRRHGPSSSQPWTTDNNDPKFAYMDPGIPGVQEHVVGMLTDVVRRYDVDGVHLDYLRYSSHLAGYHNTNVARFNQLGNGNFDDWRRQQTEDLARRIWLEVTAIDPTVTVSMAAIAQGDGPVGPDLMASWRTRKAYADKFQDWVTWLDEGIIDAVYPMAYFRESSHGDWYDHWVDFVASLDTERPVAIGQAAYLNTIGQSLGQVDQALAATDGLVVYAWQQDSTNAAQGELLRQIGGTRFTEPAPAPDPTWKTDTTEGHALVTVADGVSVTATRGTETVTAVGDATGHAGFLNLSAGTWTFSAPGFGQQLVQIRATEVARVAL